MRQDPSTTLADTRQSVELHTNVNITWDRQRANPETSMPTLVQSPSPSRRLGENTMRAFSEISYLLSPLWSTPVCHTKVSTIIHKAVYRSPLCVRVLDILVISLYLNSRCSKTYPSPTQKASQNSLTCACHLTSAVGIRVSCDHSIRIG